MGKPIGEIMRLLWLIAMICLYPATAAQAGRCCPENQESAYTQVTAPMTVSGLPTQVTGISPLPALSNVQSPVQESESPLSCPCCPPDAASNECTNCVGCANGSVAGMIHASTWNLQEPHLFMDLIGPDPVPSRSVAPDIRPPKQTCS